MKQSAIGLAVALLVAACAPQDEGPNTDDFAEYELERAIAEATGQDPDAVPYPGDESADEDFAPEGEAGADGDAEAIDPPEPDLTDGEGVTDNPDISDEQDFEAVASRESIESDAERLKRNAELYELAEEEDLPSRTSASEPNIVKYALEAPNKKGEALYERSVLSGDGRFQRNCAKYNSPDDAQRAFLKRGGPERDPLGIDPDGDGYACGWDPTPFQELAGL